MLFSSHSLREARKNQLKGKMVSKVKESSNFNSISLETPKRCNVFPLRIP